MLPAIVEVDVVEAESERVVHVASQVAIEDDLLFGRGQGNAGEVTDQQGKTSELGESFQGSHVRFGEA